MRECLFSFCMLVFFHIRYFNLHTQSEMSSSRNSEIKLVPMPDFDDMTDHRMERERSSPPPILRRRKLMHNLQQRTETPDSGNQSDYIGQQVQIEGNITPSTPIKQLPFSPSQFLNSLSPEASWPRASTPKGNSPGPLTTPQPTGFHRSQDGTSILLFFTRY